MLKKTICVVIPAFNEGKGIRRLLDEKIRPVFEKIKGYKTEVILVDDGSRDGTRFKAEESELFRERKVKIVVLSRNFGKEAAVTAGVQVAFQRGASAVVIMDGDGQHPAEAILEMIQRWERGVDVVKAIREKGKDGRRHKLGSRIYYKLSKSLGNFEIKEGEMDFGLYDRVVIEEFLKFTEHKRIFRGLIDYLGFPKDYVTVKIEERMGGEPSYSARKLAVLAADSIVSSSRRPLLIFGVIGAGIMVFSGALGLFVLIEEYLLNDPMGLDWAGAVAVSIFVAFLVGLVLVSQTVMGIYISQIHQDAMGRPLFVIDKKRSKL